jgi:two-component system, sensor histidine kinase PdtaS
MRVLLLSFFVILTFHFSASGQDAVELPAQLMQSVRQSRPDTNRISLELKLGSYYLFKPGSYPNDMDSTIKHFNNAMELSNILHSDEWKYKTLALIGNYEFEIDHREKGYAIIKQVAAYYHQHDELVEEAETLSKAGELLDKATVEEEQERLDCLANAERLYTVTHRYDDQLGTIEYIAYVNVLIGRTDVAERELLSGLKQIEKRPSNLIDDFEYDLAKLYVHKGMYQRGLFYILKILPDFSAKGVEHTAGYWSMAGNIYHYMSMYDKALFCNNKALEGCDKDHLYDYLMFLNAHTQYLLALNRPKEALDDLVRATKMRTPVDVVQKGMVLKDFGQCYYALKQNKLAGIYFDKMVNNFKEGEKERTLVSTDFFVRSVATAVDFFVTNSQYQKAAAYYKIISPYINKEFANVEAKTEILLVQIKLDSASGEYKKAFTDLRLYKKINDSIYNSTKSQQMTEMQTQYETSKKEHAIRLLQSQGKAQNLELEKAHIQRNVTLGSVAFLLILTSLAYNRYRFKQKTNTALETKQQEINLKNESLQNLLNDKDKLIADKDWLIKEVHHRVKNNLHTVICLLESQASYLENDALKAIQISQHRIYAMSLIHQKLYQADDITTIDVAIYLKEFIGYLVDSFGTEGTIAFKLDLEPLKISVAQAIPVALIINEAVTNSIKYAFPGVKKGEIAISLKEQRNVIELIIVDNGVGINPAVLDLELESMGLALIKGLTTELKGKLEIQNNNGTSIMVVFNFEQILSWPKDFQLPDNITIAS